MEGLIELSRIKSSTAEKLWELLPVSNEEDGAIVLNICFLDFVKLEF